MDALYLEHAGGGLAPGASAGSVAQARLADLDSQISFQRTLQDLGYRYGVSSGAVFGVSVTQAPYCVLKDSEFLYRDTVMSFPHEEVLASKDDPHDAYFRGYANRLCYRARCELARGTRRGLPPWWDAEYAAINRAYCAVRDQMYYPRLLGDGRGVLWDGLADEVQVLWTYGDFPWRTGQEAQVYDVMARRTVSLQDGTFTAGARRIYLVQEALEP